MGRHSHEDRPCRTHSHPIQKLLSMTLDKCHSLARIVIGTDAEITAVTHF